MSVIMLFCIYKKRPDFCGLQSKTNKKEKVKTVNNNNDNENQTLHSVAVSKKYRMPSTNQLQLNVGLLVPTKKFSSRSGKKNAAAASLNKVSPIHRIHKKKMVGASSDNAKSISYTSTSNMSTRRLPHTPNSRSLRKDEYEDVSINYYSTPAM